MRRAVLGALGGFVLAIAAVPVLPCHAATPSGIEETARQTVLALKAGHFGDVAEGFDERMREALPPDRLAAVWRQLMAQAGPLQTIGTVTVQTQGSMSIASVTCQFQKAPLLVQLAFDETGRISGLHFLPVPAPAAKEEAAPPVGVREIELSVGKHPWKLPGTLTLPEGKGPFPAVVLVHGSGPHDQDETIGPNKPFRDLAWGLARHGIATLRYEKRTHRYPSRCAKAKSFTVEQETIEDARAATALLASRPEVDHSRIFLLGHSLGGTLAPRIAEGNPHVAGLIILAGATRPLEQLAVEQLQYLAGLDGTVTRQESEQIAAARKAAEAIQSPGLEPAGTVDFLGSATPGSYWLDLRGYDPAATAAKLELPMLILQGGRDYQVTTADLQGWKRALAGHSKVMFKVYPTLNHLFMDAGETGPSGPAEYQRAGHVSLEVIRNIAAWIEARKGNEAAEGKREPPVKTTRS